MKGPGPSPGQVARYLRQQGELGGPDLFLGDLNRQEAMDLALRREDPRSGAADTKSGSEASDGRARSPRVSEAPAGLTEGPSAGTGGTGEYELARQEALVCQKCSLARTRANVVFSDGNPSARLMVVGEAPGAQEDKTGLAFVGPAGKLLDLLLASVDLSRKSSVYICNVLKCRPPGNRNPLPEEIQACTPFLQRQIELISPEAILAVGTFAGQFLTGKAIPLGRLRGEVYSYQGVPVVVTYHPAALLRNSGWTQATWDDLQLLRQVMGGG